MFSQEEFDHGTQQVAASRYLADAAFWSQIRDCSFDPESFVPVSPKEHALAHAIKGDSEFATDDKHGPLQGPIVEFLIKHPAQRVRTAELGEVFLARRVIMPSRNLTVWVYPPDAEGCLRQFHAAP